VNWPCSSLSVHLPRPGSWVWPNNQLRMDVALLVLRIACAAAFLYHGSAILFGSFGGPGPQEFAAAHSFPRAVGYLVGMAEVGGGVAVASGVFIRTGAVCIVVVMAGAIFLVHLPHGYDVGNGGAECALTQALIAIALLIAGAGSYSLAKWLPPALRKL
jgi:putative oxidoreductase